MQYFSRWLMPWCSRLDVRRPGLHCDDDDNKMNASPFRCEEAHRQYDDAWNLGAVMVDGLMFHDTGGSLVKANPWRLLTVTITIPLGGCPANRRAMQVNWPGVKRRTPVLDNYSGEFD